MDRDASDYSCITCKEVNDDCVGCEYDGGGTLLCTECAHEYQAPGHDGTTCEMRDWACSIPLRDQVSKNMPNSAGGNALVCPSCAHGYFMNEDEETGDMRCAKCIDFMPDCMSCESSCIC